MKLEIGQKVYLFDENRRVYEENGVKYSAPIYKYHFKEYIITEENEKEYLVDKGYFKINKRSNLMDRMRYFTEQEMNDKIFIHDNGHKIAEKIRYLNDANKLKEIIDILN